MIYDKNFQGIQYSILWLRTFTSNMYGFIYSCGLQKKGFGNRVGFGFWFSALSSISGLSHIVFDSSSSIHVVQLQELLLPPEMVATMWLDHTPYTLTCSFIPFGSTYFMNSSIEPEISKRVHVDQLQSIIIRDRIETNFK